VILVGTRPERVERLQHLADAVVVGRGDEAIQKTRLVLGGGDLDEASWEAVEETLLIADLGPVVTDSIVTSLRSRMARLAVVAPDGVRRSA